MRDGVRVSIFTEFVTHPTQTKNFLGRGREKLAKKVVIFWDRKNQQYYYVNPKNKREKIVSESASLLRREILGLKDDKGRASYRPIFRRDAEIEFRSNHS